jgi:hypothetical protein
LRVIRHPWRPFAGDTKPDVEELWPFYQGLIDKYMPGELWW